MNEEKCDLDTFLSLMDEIDKDEKPEEKHAEVKLPLNAIKNNEEVIDDDDDDTILSLMDEYDEVDKDEKLEKNHAEASQPLNAIHNNEVINDDDDDVILSLMDEYDEVDKNEKATETRQTQNAISRNKEEETEVKNNDDDDDDDEELLTLASQQIEESQSLPSSISKADLKTESPKLVSPTGNPAESELLAEMRRMQERIQMLESQLQTQKQPPQKTSADIKKQTPLTSVSTSEAKTSESKPSKPPATQRKSTSNSESANKISFAEAIKAASSKSQPSDDSKLNCLNGKAEKDLFGDFEDDDDDDENEWTGLDGERGSELSQSGKDLKRMLEDAGKKRVAHHPKQQAESSASQPPVKITTSNLEKASSSYITSLMGIPNAPGMTSSYTSDHCSALRTSGVKEENIVKEQYSGIRIINPLISADHMRTLMDDRRMIKLSSLRQKLGGCELDGDWVTMGVLVSKSEQRVSAKGQQYCIWKLSDLTDCDQAPISMFLFRDINTAHCKTLVGTVLGFLNPSVMSSNKDDKWKKSNDLSLTVDNVKKILPLGISKDLGTCKGRTKVGNTCNNFVNVAQGEHCSYHVQAAYKKQSSKRSELQNGFSGVAPKFKKEMDKIRNYGQSVSYKNDVFTTKPMPKNVNKVSLQSLLNHQKDLAHRGQNNKKSEFNTLLLHDLLPDPKVKTTQGHVKDASQHVKVTSRDASGQVKAAPGQVKNTPGQIKTTPGEGLKDEKHFHDLLMKPTAGSMNFVKYLKDLDGKPAISPNSKKPEKVPEVTAEEVFKDLIKKPPSTPKLGRGVDKDGFINLDSPPTFRDAKQALANEKAKLNALQKIKEMGGLKRKDPNCTKVDRHDKTYQERIKKRLREIEENDQTTTNPPPAKKSKLLGNVDMNSEEIQKLINAKSAHANLLSAEEEMRQEQYFNVLEKTERMEEKMANTREIKVNAFTCFQCKYTALSLSDLCISEGHQTSKVKATKRFFRCKECKNKCFSLDRLPTLPCSKCGGNDFEQTGMMTERKGPKTQELLLRGEERKFINSL